MNKEINILDSTLRDGGYCNNWEFGYENKKRIVDSLIASDVDVIECGLLSKGEYSREQSKYSNILDVSEFISRNGFTNKLFVVLMNYGDYDIASLPDCENTDIDGIRLAFHKKDVAEAIEAMKMLKEKHYKVFMQPMVTVNYTTDEYVSLISNANKFEPYAFYIVDSFGNMKADALKKYFELANYLLNTNIILGLHTHNNLQLAYSNAQLFAMENTDRKRMIDCCIMGMGRGAGNLNTELVLNYMNTYRGTDYKVEPILKAIDNIISIFYQKKYWGYSLPNYLSASHNMHPNYGTFLADKNTLTIEMMNEVLSLVDFERRNTFDKKYIEELYVSYMSANSMKNTARQSLKEIFSDKEVLIISPGKSIDTENDKILSFLAVRNLIKISVNFECKTIPVDYIFVSNPKRYEALKLEQDSNLIATSNIRSGENAIIVDYFNLLSEENYVRDNSTMMLIKLLIESGASKIYLAGVDGYDNESKDNYTILSSTLVTSYEYMTQMNKAMTNMLHKYMQEIDIQFVTSEKMIRRV